MTDVLDAIGEDVIRAAQRRAWRRKRRGRAALLAAGVSVTAAAALAAAGAFERAPADLPAPVTPDAGYSQIGVRPSGGEPATGSIAAYRSIDGTVCIAATETGRDLPPAACLGGMPLADSLYGDDIVALASMAPDGADGDSVAYGLVLANTHRLTLIGLNEEGFAADISPGKVTVPVSVPPHALTEAGRERLARLPSEVSVSVFAVRVPAGSIAASGTRVEVESSNGSIRRGKFELASR